MDEEKKDSTDKSAEKPENKILGSQENNPDIAKNCSAEKGTSQAEESSSSQVEESKHATDPSLTSSETKGSFRLFWRNAISWFLFCTSI